MIVGILGQGFSENARELDLRTGYLVDPYSFLHKKFDDFLFHPRIDSQIILEGVDVQNAVRDHHNFA